MHVRSLSNTPHPCQKCFEARDVGVYDEQGGPDRLGWYCAPGGASLHRGVCRGCASEADGWCEGGVPQHVNYEDVFMLLNKIPAHRSRLAGHEVEDVIQWLMQRAAEVKVRDA